jgi:hypothetical protein
MFNNEVSKRFNRLVALYIDPVFLIYQYSSVQGFFTFSAEPTEDLGLDQLEDADDESPLAAVPGGDQELSKSSDDKDGNNSDEEMEESSEPSSDSELSEEEDDDDDGVYLPARVNDNSNISLQAADLAAFAEELGLDKFPVP